MALDMTNLQINEPVTQPFIITGDISRDHSSEGSTPSPQGEQRALEVGVALR